MITQEAIQEFNKLWLKKYGHQLSEADALAKATTLLTLFKSIYIPIKLENHDH